MMRAIGNSEEPRHVKLDELRVRKGLQKLSIFMRDGKYREWKREHRGYPIVATNVKRSIGVTKLKEFTKYVAENYYSDLGQHLKEMRAEQEKEQEVANVVMVHLANFKMASTWAEPLGFGEIPPGIVEQAAMINVEGVQNPIHRYVNRLIWDFVADRYKTYT